MSFCSQCGHHSWAGGLLTPNEMQEWLSSETLPSGFRARCEMWMSLLREGVDSCPNCDGQRCMHFRLRDWYSEDFDECSGRCCPDCSDVRYPEVDVA